MSLKITWDTFYLSQGRSRHISNAKCYVPCMLNPAKKCVTALHSSHPSNFCSPISPWKVSSKVNIRCIFCMEVLNVCTLKWVLLCRIRPHGGNIETLFHIVDIWRILIAEYNAAVSFDGIIIIFAKTVVWVKQTNKYKQWKQSGKEHHGSCFIF